MEQRHHEAKVRGMKNRVLFEDGTMVSLEIKGQCEEVMGIQTVRITNVLIQVSCALNSSVAQINHLTIIYFIPFLQEIELCSKSSSQKAVLKIEPIFK